MFRPSSGAARNSDTAINDLTRPAQPALQLTRQAKLDLIMPGFAGSRTLTEGRRSWQAPQSYSLRTIRSSPTW